MSFSSGWSAAPLACVGVGLGLVGLGRGVGAVLGIAPGVGVSVWLSPQNVGLGADSRILLGGGISCSAICSQEEVYHILHRSPSYAPSRSNIAAPDVVEAVPVARWVPPAASPTKSLPPAAAA